MIESFDQGHDGPNEKTHLNPFLSTEVGYNPETFPFEIYLLEGFRV
jgi:hypothetical protein